MSGALLIRGVSKTYDAEGAGVEALRECSFEVRAEEFVAIVGPSGCGKTTLLNAIAGFDTVSAGEIVLDGRVLAARPGPDRVVVFQHGALFPWKTVLENVTYGPLKQRALSRPAAEAKALEFLRASGGTGRSMPSSAEAKPLKLLLQPMPMPSGTPSSVAAANAAVARQVLYSMCL